MRKIVYNIKEYFDTNVPKTNQVEHGHHSWSYRQTGEQLDPHMIILNCFKLNEMT